MESDEEVKQRMLRQMQEEHKQEEEAVETQKQMLLRQILTPEARERLLRIKVVRPQFAELVENQLIALVQRGQISGLISDSDLKLLLSKILPKKRDINIRRK
jgi:programmed cell death protein 5